VHDLFETRIGSEIVYIVAAIGKAALFPLDVRKQRAADDDALQAAIDDDSHC